MELKSLLRDAYWSFLLCALKHKSYIFTGLSILWVYIRLKITQIAMYN